VFRRDKKVPVPVLAPETSEITLMDQIMSGTHARVLPFIKTLIMAADVLSTTIS